MSAMDFCLMNIMHISQLGSIRTSPNLGNLQYQQLYFLMTCAFVRGDPSLSATGSWDPSTARTGMAYHLLKRTSYAAGCALKLVLNFLIYFIK